MTIHENSTVVGLHVEEAAHLRNVRSSSVRAPNVGLLQLGRLDERLAAHLDGVAVAGECGIRMARAALERPGTGTMFVATVRAIEDADRAGLDGLLAISEAVPESRAGLLSAFGWVGLDVLRGICKSLLDAQSPWQREVGLAACAMHGIDPSDALRKALASSEARLRARALRIAGECGLTGLESACLAAVSDPNPTCAHEAARSGLLLGDRRVAIEALEVSALAPDVQGASALRLALMVLPAQSARELLARVAGEPMHRRRLLQGIGLAGDAHHVPWLIAQMADPAASRPAGEAFSLLTGVDLAYMGLDRKPPEEVAFNPRNDPNDDDVAMDEDESLPWPDPARIESWWHANGTRLLPGRRYFMGQPVSAPYCLHILKTGFQRQRCAAASHLCLLRPRSPRFNVRAPTWRQLRLLDTMIG